MSVLVGILAGGGSYIAIVAIAMFAMTLTSSAGVHAGLIMAASVGGAVAALAIGFAVAQ